MKFVSRHAFAMSFLCLAMASPALADKPAAHARDEADLRALISAQTDAWNRHDAVAWCKDFAPDAEFVNIVGTLLVGQAEIQQRHAAIFETLFRASKDVVTVRKVTFLSKDIALVDTEHEVTGYTRLPPGVQPTDASGALKTRMHFVFQKTGKAWRIVHAQNTDEKPLPPPPPSPAASGAAR